MFPGTHLILLRTACSKVRFRTRIVYWNVITPKDASGCITIIPHVLSSVSLLKFLLFLILNIEKAEGSRGKVCAQKKIDNEM